MSGPPGAAASRRPDPDGAMVGRDRELESCVSWLTAGAPRQVTVCGLGGIGKTRFVIEVARWSASRQWPTWFLSLEDARSFDQVMTVVDQVLGTEGIEPSSLLDALKLRHTGGPALLALDGVEQVAGPVAAMAAEAIAGIPELRLVIGSRPPLGMEGEQALRLEPLPVPIEGLDASQLKGNPSVALYQAHARRCGAHTTGSPSRGLLVADLCRRLDGHPMAIRIAAAYSALLPDEQLASHIRSRRALHHAVDPLATGHHRSLEKSVSWSLEMLPEDARQAAPLLSLLRGDWTAADAAAVCATEAIEPVLAHLVRHSLLSEEPGDPAPRYRMLGILGEVLAAMAPAEAIAGAAANHAGWFLRRRGADAASEVSRDRANLLAALDWAAEHSPAAGLECLAETATAWQLGRWGLDAIDRCEHLLKAPGLPPLLRGRGWLLLAALAGDRGRDEEAQAALESALECGRAVGDDRLVGGALANLGVHNMTADPAAARAQLEEAAEALRRAGRPGAATQCRVRLGSLHLMQGDLDRAEVALGEAHREAAEQEDRHAIAEVLQNQAELARLRGEASAAERLRREALRIRTEVEDVRAVLTLLLSMATGAAGRREYARAVILLHGARAMGHRIGIAPDDVDQQEETACFRAALACLSTGQAMRAGELGSLMDEADLLSYAIEGGHGILPPGAGAEFCPFNAAELRVLRCADEIGETSTGRIAGRISASPNTVKTHFRDMLAITGLASRSEVVAVARANGWLAGEYS